MTHLPDSDLRELEGHDPGPWTIRPYGDGDSLVIESAPDWRICFMATPGGSEKAWAKIKANARLIAAAPSLIADLREARERQVWQPIESAPKDGTPILAWCVHPHARWATDSKEWACAVVTQWIKHNGGGWTWNGMAGSFTHWFPLPDAPDYASESGG